MLANIFDQINQLMFGLNGANGAKPLPIERPGSSERYEAAEVVDVNERIGNVKWREVGNGG